VAGERSIQIERIGRLDAETAATVDAILQRAAVHDARSPIGEHKFVRLVEGEADTFGLVARLGADGPTIGYAQATRYPRHGPLPRRLAAELLVDPGHRQAGIGRALTDRLIEAARQAGDARFDVWAHHADAAANGLAASYGMRISRQLWQMALRLDSVAPRHRLKPVPEGIRVRRFREGQDEQLLIGLIREAFAEHPENAVFDADDLANRATLPWFDPSAILIAEDAGTARPLGMHWMKLAAPPVGEVYILAVAPWAHGRGIGRLLLLHGLEEMRERGVEVAILYVDAGNDAAIGLYRQAGFRFEHLDTCYSLDLRSA
jgi:mycothiol synthase